MRCPRSGQIQPVDGGCCPLSANSASGGAHVCKHPDVVDAELAREIAARRIIGSFTEPPWHNMHTSGIGVVPKKNDKWNAISSTCPLPDAPISGVFSILL